MSAAIEEDVSWVNAIYNNTENLIIGQRLGVSYLRSQKESISLCVDTYSLQLYQSSTGTSAISGVVWDAGLFLSDYMVANRAAAVGRVLDIGCGTGVCGITALFLGATKVSFTDAFIPPSFNDNFNQLSENHKAQTTFISYDWSSEILCSKLKSPMGATICQSSTNSMASGDFWDTVLCSDLLYDEKTHEPLLKVLKQIHFKKVIFSYKRRHDEPEKSFFQRLSKFCSLKVVQSDSFKLSNITFAETSGLFIVIATPIEIMPMMCCQKNKEISFANG
jgi:predicted nicotinamide N-methyase